MPSVNKLSVNILLQCNSDNCISSWQNGIAKKQYLNADVTQSTAVIQIIAIII